MSKIAATALLALGLGACALDSEETTEPLFTERPETTLSVSAMQAQSDQGRVSLDLASAEIGFHVEADVALDVVQVTCPSGQRMNLDTWLDDIITDGAALDPDEPFLIFSSGRDDLPRTERPPACFDPCYLHQEPDRTWVCFCPAR